MRNKLINTLINIGLTEKEAEVYLASLSLGSATVQKIAVAADVKRTTVYSILVTLKQKGLIRTELKGWKALYMAESPEKLESMIDRMRHDIRRTMPEFESLYNLHSSGAFIKYYEGLESVKGVYESMLRDVRPHENYSVIGDNKQWLEQDPDFFSDFLRRRAKLNINIRVLIQDSETAREHKKMEKTFNEKVKIMPPDFKLTTNMAIIPCRVIINQLTPPLLAMVIENESIIKMNQELFEAIWRSIPD